MPDTRAPLYLIAGGHGLAGRRGPDPLLAEVVRRTGVRRPRVAYVGAASGDNAAFRLLVGRMLQKAGSGEVSLAPLCGKRASSAAAKSVLESADLIFISGGDVEAGMAVLAETGMLAFLRGLLKAGKPFFGISAGSIMLGRKWVRWTDPRDDRSAELFPCMGFAPVLCDTHGEGDDWGELKSMLALCPVGTTGYGIVSGAALLIEPGCRPAALGGEVHVFRRRKAGVGQVENLVPAAVTV